MYPVIVPMLVFVELVLKPIPLSVTTVEATPLPFTVIVKVAEAGTFEPLLPIVTFVPGTAIV